MGKTEVNLNLAQRYSTLTVFGSLVERFKDKHQNDEKNTRRLQRRKKGVRRKCEASDRKSNMSCDWQQQRGNAATDRGCMRPLTQLVCFYAKIEDTCDASKVSGDSSDVYLQNAVSRVSPNV